MLQGLFFFFAFVSIFTSLLVVFSKKPVHSVLFLILTFVSITCLYIILNAQFLAIVNLIVYAGAIMVLFLFVLMLLNLDQDSEPKKSFAVKGAAVLSAGLLMIVLTSALRSSITGTLPEASTIGLVENLGKQLFTTYVIPFEISSVLFLAAMVGAVLIAKREKKEQSSELIDHQA